MFAAMAYVNLVFHKNKIRMRHLKKSQFNDTLANTNSFRNLYFSVNQSDLGKIKERINKLLIGLR